MAWRSSAFSVELYVPLLEFNHSRRKRSGENAQEVLPYRPYIPRSHQFTHSGTIDVTDVFEIKQDSRVTGRNQALDCVAQGPRTVTQGDPPAQVDDRHIARLTHGSLTNHWEDSQGNSLLRVCLCRSSRRYYKDS